MATKGVPKEPQSLDAMDLGELDYNALTQRQMDALNQIGSINKRKGGIGETSLTGRDYLTAEEMTEDAPTSMETGFGPQEQNPQQRYQSRFQQRSGYTMDDGTEVPSNYDDLTNQYSLAQVMQARAAKNPTNRIERSGDGERGGYDSGPASIGQTALGEYGLGSLAGVDSYGKQALGKAALGGLASSGAGYGLGPGISMGLQSALFSPLAVLNLFDTAAGEGMKQSNLDRSMREAGLSREEAASLGDTAAIGKSNADLSGLAGLMGDVETAASVGSLTPGELAGLQALGTYEATPTRASIQGLRSILGTDDYGYGDLGSTVGMATDALADKTADTASYGMGPDLSAALAGQEMGFESTMSPEALGLFQARALAETERAKREEAQAARAAVAPEQIAMERATAIQGGIADAFGESVAALDSTFGDPMGLMGGFSQGAIAQARAAQAQRDAAEAAMASMASGFGGDGSSGGGLGGLGRSAGDYGTEGHHGTRGELSGRSGGTRGGGGMGDLGF